MNQHIFSLIAALMASASASNNLPKSNENSVEGHNKVVVCYWGTWSNYRLSRGNFQPENVDPALCTHLIYSFAGLNDTTSKITSLDPWMDLDLEGFKKATSLKDYYSHLTVTLAIGGWNEGSTRYSEMASDPLKREIFVKSVVQFLRIHNFDGLDIDWEYPGARDGKPEDKVNFITLIRELREAFDNFNFILTAAIGAAKNIIDVSYNVREMYKYLDYVHVMCYDYHGQWDNKTGYNAPLFSRPDETGKDRFQNIHFTLKYLKALGADPEKTVLGVAFYGRAYILENHRDNLIGDKTKAKSFQGPYTREDGFMGYNEICEEFTQRNNRWTISFDKYYQAPYMVRGNKWVSYDNERSIRIKTQFAYDQGLAGVMAWSIDTDDFTGRCSGNKFPLLRAINNALYRKTAGLPDQSAGTMHATLSISIAVLVGALFFL